jgi:PPP family 3-phenylpropionic acid transporter
VDTAAVKIITDEGGDPRDYGRLRLWGTVGFLLGSAAGAQAMASASAEGAALWLAVGAWALASSLAFLLPAGPAAAPAPIWPALRRLAGSPFLAPLLLALCLHGMGLTVYDTTLPMHMEGLGLGGTWLAVALAAGLLAEIAVMWWGRHLIAWLGPFRMLTLAGATGVLRWGLTAVVTTPALLAGLQVLHGVVYAVFWLGGVEAMRRHAPEEVRVSAQSLLSTTAYGVGSLLSSLAVATALDALGTAGLFGLAAVASVLATGGLLLAWRRAPR